MSTSVFKKLFFNDKTKKHAPSVSQCTSNEQHTTAPLSSEIVPSRGEAPPSRIDIDTLENATEDTEVPLPLTPDPSPRRDKDQFAGTVLAGRYEIQELIGKGGMGRVYRAYQRAVDRTVAVKILGSAMAKNQDLVKRFGQEARAASRLSHPNTITIHDFGHAADVLFIVMEYLQGHPLSRLYNQSPTPKRVLRIMTQICGSLAEAHDKGIIHRDLKPGNILLNRLGKDQEFVKVLDFGIAKIKTVNATVTQGGILFGTPKYMSPEQIRGDSIDNRSDIYSLGILMYELLSGTPVFNVNSTLSYFYKHTHTMPAPLNTVPSHHPISDELSSAVMKMLNKNPNDRFQKVQELIPIFNDFLKRGRDSVPPLSTLDTIPPPSIQPHDTARHISMAGVAEARLKSQLSHKPDDVSILKMLAKLYENNREYEKAAQVYAKVGEQYIQSNHHKDAVPILVKVINIDKNHIKARSLLAQSYSHLGKTDSAVMLFKDLIRTFEKRNDSKNLKETLLKLHDIYSETENHFGAKTVQKRLGELTKPPLFPQLEAPNDDILQTSTASLSEPIDKDLPEIHADLEAVDEPPTAEYISKARRLIRDTGYQEALTYIRKVLILDPENRDALPLAATVLKEGQSSLSPDERAWLKILELRRRIVATILGDSNRCRDIRICGTRHHEESGFGIGEKDGAEIPILQRTDRDRRICHQPNAGYQ